MLSRLWLEQQDLQPPIGSNRGSTVMDHARKSRGKTVLVVRSKIMLTGPVLPSFALQILRHPPRHALQALSSSGAPGAARRWYLHTGGLLLAWCIACYGTQRTPSFSNDPKPEQADDSDWCAPLKFRVATVTKKGRSISGSIAPCQLSGRWTNPARSCTTSSATFGRRTGCSFGTHVTVRCPNLIVDISIFLKAT